MKRAKRSRLLAALLTVAMLTSMLPMLAIAAEPDGEVEEPCTVTEGYTLTAGHEGECVTEPDEPTDGNKNDYHETDDGTDEESGIMLTAGDEDTTTTTSGNCGAPVSENGEVTDAVTWSFDSTTGTLTISGSGAMADYENPTDTSSTVVAPWYAIKESIDKLEIKSGVSSIGKYAFYGLEGLKTVTFEGNTLESIGECGFGCYSEELTSFELPDSVKTLGKWALSLPGITTITIPASLETIGECALANCTGLTAFFVADGNTVFSVEDGVLFKVDGNSKELTAYPVANADTSYSIPDGTTAIGTYAFNGAGNLTTIVIPDSVTDLQTKAFQNTGLISISIPNTVTTIGAEILRNCKSLEYLYYDSSATLTGNTILENVGANTANGLTIVFGDSVTAIPAHFAHYGNVSNNPNVTAVSWKCGVSVGEQAFYKCKGLKTILVRGNSDSSAQTAVIGNAAFTDVPATVFTPSNISGLSLTQKVYPVNEERAVEADSVTSIDDFDDLGLLGTLSYNLASESDDFTVDGKVVSLIANPTSTSAEINVSLKVKGVDADVNLGSITLKYAGQKETVTGISGDWGYSYEYYANVPADGVLSLTSYNGSSEVVKLPETLSVSIDGTSGSETISVDGVASGFSANSLNTVVVPSTIKTIAAGAFSSGSLTEVFFLPGSNCESVGETAFGSANVYCDAALADTLREHDNTFTVCDMITDMSGENSLVIAYLVDGTLTLTGTGKMRDITSYNGAPWYNMRSRILTAKIDEGITYIGAYFLNDCTNVKTITIPDSVASLAQNALSSPSFEVVYIDSNFSDSQGNYSSRYLTNLKANTVVFGESVTSIPDYLLNDNTNVRKIIIKGTPSSIGSNICQKAGNVTQIYVIDDATAQKITGTVKSTNSIFVIGNGAVVDEGAESDGFRAVSKNGYYAEWYLDSSFSADKKISNTDPTANNTYYANWINSAYSLEQLLAFDSLTYGAAPVARTITVTASGVENPSVTSVTNSDSFAASISGMAVTITPNSALPVGTYNETLVITTGDGATHDITATVTINKANQALSFAESTLTVHISAVTATNALNHTAGDGAVTYISSNGEVAGIDGNGEVTIKGVGKTTITAAAAGTNNYNEAVTSYTLTVEDHIYGESWESDENGHWHECTVCNEKDTVSAHTFQWVIDKEATTTDKGSKHEECSVCQYKKEAVVIPAIGNAGKTDDNKSDNKTDNKTGNSSKAQTTSAQTGDSSHVGIWFSLLAVSLLGIGAMLFVLRKRTYHDR